MEDIDFNLCDALKKLAQELGDQKGKVVVFGSSAIILNEVDLRRSAKDLDVFVSDELFNDLGQIHEIKYKDGQGGEQVPYISIDGLPNTEILKSFPGVFFKSVFEKAVVTPSSEGFKVGSLEDLKTWKSSQGRAKDKEDISAIENHLASRCQ